MAEIKRAIPQTETQKVAAFAWCSLGDANGNNVTEGQINFVLRAEQKVAKEEWGRTLEGNLGKFGLNDLIPIAPLLVKRVRLHSAVSRGLEDEGGRFTTTIIISDYLVSLNERYTDLRTNAHINPGLEPETRRLQGRVNACQNALALLDRKRLALLQ